jgi:hypothetical protein
MRLCNQYVPDVQRVSACSRHGVALLCGFDTQSLAAQSGQRLPHAADLAFDPSNLVPLCLNCHALIERKIERGYSTEIGVDGMPLDPKHPCYQPRPVVVKPTPRRR